LTSGASSKPQILKLDKAHATDGFNCGSAALNTYLQRFALSNQSAGGAQTYAAILIARLAVDRAWQGKGLGAGLLLDSLRRVLSAADIVGIRAVLVHAKDDAARRFYEHFDFDPSPVDPPHLFLLVKEIAGLIKVP
jgi:GNAT superfamily N-acetyltransferase